MFNNVVMSKNKHNKPFKYTYDTTYFFEKLKENNINQFSFCDKANISPSVLYRYYKGRNIETDTIIHFTEALEQMIGHELDNKELMFKIVEIKDK